MCTVQLTYDPNNALAQKSLAALLATGQFIADEATKERFSIDYSDPWLYEEEDDLPIPLNRNLSLGELENLVVADIRSICGVKDAVSIH